MSNIYSYLPEHQTISLFSTRSSFSDLFDGCHNFQILHIGNTCGIDWKMLKQIHTKAFFTVWILRIRQPILGSQLGAIYIILYIIVIHG